MARMRMVEADTVDPELKDVFEKMKQSGPVLNVWRMMAWSPALAKVWAPFSRGLRNDLSVSRRLRSKLVSAAASTPGTLSTRSTSKGPRCFTLAAVA